MHLIRQRLDESGLGLDAQGKPHLLREEGQKGEEEGLSEEGRLGQRLGWKERIKEVVLFVSGFEGCIGVR